MTVEKIGAQNRHGTLIFGQDLVLTGAHSWPQVPSICPMKGNDVQLVFGDKCMSPSRISLLSF